MKAGAFTPAIPGVTTLPNGWQPRSMKAGAFTPAILSRHLHDASCYASLNEGGGLHPRNPLPSCMTMGFSANAQ